MKSIRTEGRALQALLILLKHLTAHARWVFAVLLLLYAFSGLRSIAPQEQALVLRFGKLQPKVHGPGLLLSLPDPFDTVLRFDTQKDISIPLDDWSLLGNKIKDPDQAVKLTDAELTKAVQLSENGGAAMPKYEVPAGATLDPVQHGYTITSDFNVIQGRFSLRYRIAEPFTYASAGPNVTKLLADLSYRALCVGLAARPIDENLTSGRRELAAQAATSIQQLADRLGIGIRVTSLDFVELSPPSQVLDAFEDVANARLYGKTMYENSRQYLEQSLAKSRGESSAILSRANGHGQTLVSEAQGEAVAFQALLAEYQQEGAILSRRILRETLDTVMSNVHSRTLLPVEQSTPALIIEPSPEYAR